jgi:hypothetical protein
MTIGTCTRTSNLSLFLSLLPRCSQCGPAFPLVCERHPDRRLDVAVPEDFLQAANGGCAQTCDERLPCGHACTLMYAPPPASPHPTSLPSTTPSWSSRQPYSHILHTCNVPCQPSANPPSSSHPLPCPPPRCHPRYNREHRDVPCLAPCPRPYVPSIRVPQYLCHLHDPENQIPFIGTPREFLKIFFLICVQSCVRGHACPHPCSTRPCPPCTITVPFAPRRLPCGHSPNKLPCHVIDDLTAYKCRDKVPYVVRTLSSVFP